MTERMVEVIEIEPQRVADSLELLGRTEPWRQAALYFEVPGVVDEMLVEEGDEVDAGQPVARLKLEDYRLAVARAQAELKATQARLELLLAGTRREDLDAAKADYQRARVRAAYWTGELKRNTELYKKGGITAADLEQVQREYGAALQEERATRAVYERAVAGPRPEEIEEARAAVQAQTQAGQLAQRQLEKATLLAPFAGRIEQRLVDEGTYINVFPTGGVPVVLLVDSDPLDVVIPVPELHRARAQQSRTVEIVSASDSKLRGEAQVVSLATVADPATGTYALRVRLPNPGTPGRFGSEMVVWAKIAGESEREVIRVPVGAVRRPYGQPAEVYVVDAEQQVVVTRPITLGGLAGDQIEITSGLSAGELLIIRGQHRVLPGERVQYNPREIRNSKSRI